MKFGEKVRDLRKKNSLTQDELAKCLGVSKRTIIGLILINSHLDSQTKQMVCGYALGHYLEHQILMDFRRSPRNTSARLCLEQ